MTPTERIAQLLAGAGVAKIPGPLYAELKRALREADEQLERSASQLATVEEERERARDTAARMESMESIAARATLKIGESQEEANRLRAAIRSHRQATQDAARQPWSGDRDLWAALTQEGGR